MRGAVTTVYGNCIFGRDAADPWAGFALETHTYAWLRGQQKLARLQALAAALEAAAADLQILRVEPHPAAEPPRAGRRTQRAGRLDAPPPSDVTRGPRVFLFASLRDELTRGPGRRRQRGSRNVVDGLARLAGLVPRRTLSVGELEAVRISADRVGARVADHVGSRAASSSELQWLWRRAFCRGLFDPAVDDLDVPPFLTFERNGEAVLAPLEADLLRWQNTVVEPGLRHLALHGESGSARQALMMVGPLPESVDFPDAAAEHLFRAPERLPFPVDVAVNARYVSNAAAIRLARARLQDADQVVRAEADSEQGASARGAERAELAREILARLQSQSLPPLFRTSISVAVAAIDADQLEERVDACRRAFGGIRLYRPVGDQESAFIQHLPAQRSRTAGYDQILTSDQLAGLMPTAIHAAGSASGFPLGYTLTGTRRPVLFNLRDGSDGDRNTALLCVGALGTGKTSLAQKLCFDAFSAGARVVDCDPKGDHRLHLHDDVAPSAEVLALRPQRGLRGLLDPLRIAPASLKQEATVSFLRALLPHDAPPEWEAAIVSAVASVVIRSTQPTCVEVIRCIRSDAHAPTALAETLEAFSRSGLAQLGFADPSSRPPRVGSSQYTYIGLRDLPGAPLGTSRSEYVHAERVGEQVVRLVALFATQLMQDERTRLKVFAFDEGWRLLNDPVGRSLLASLQRMGRSELAVPIISTQLVNDALVDEHGSLENLVGATFAFGMRSEREAERALSLLGLDVGGPGVELLMGLRAGRCLFRDHEGRVEAIQVRLVPRSLRALLSTTPQTDRRGRTRGTP